MKHLAEQHEVFISDTVIDELVTNVWENTGVFANPDLIFGFKSFFGFHIIASKPLDTTLLAYVHDYDDAQILQDALDCKADILWTQNQKDFKSKVIRTIFHLRVTNTIK